MCVNFAPRLTNACREQDAPEVRDKMGANFCDYFAPSPAAFDGAQSGVEARARAELDALFADAKDQAAPSCEPTEADAALAKARSLFKG
jgi:hypothetical protein